MKQFVGEIYVYKHEKKVFLRVIQRIIRMRIQLSYQQSEAAQTQVGAKTIRRT